MNWVLSLAQLLWVLLWTTTAGNATAFRAASSPVSFSTAAAARYSAPSVVLSASSSSSSSSSLGSIIDEQTIVLAVFPLRKSVRLPTEPLALNLYEERYVEMATRILQQPQQPAVFGALFSSDQPSIVTEGGWGPIVPLIQPGQVGVVCLVEQSSSFDLGDDQNGTTTKRIRLVGRAVARFQVQRILSNGYSPEALPYIIVEASVFHDKPESSASSTLLPNGKVDGATTDDLDRKGRIKVWDKAARNPSGGSADDELLNGDTLPEEWTLKLLKQAQLPVTCCSDDKTLLDELKSFARASSLLPEGSSTDRLDVLRTRSLSERLELLKIDENPIRRGWKRMFGG